MKSNLRYAIALLLFLMIHPIDAQPQTQSSPREKLLMDSGWRFALGHAYDTRKDFDNGSGYFSYFAKTGYGDGAASKDFDDRGWRVLDVPHDWCVELPFDSLGSYSHGYKAIGRNFPQNSVGWYRKKFSIPESDLGKRICVEFDGVFRNSIVWVNGFISAPNTAATSASVTTFPIISITAATTLLPFALTRQWKKAGSMKEPASTGMSG